MYYLCNVSCNCNECLSETKREKIGYKKSPFQQWAQYCRPSDRERQGSTQPRPAYREAEILILDIQFKQQIFHKIFDKISQPEQLLVTFAMSNIFGQILLGYLGNKYPKHGPYMRIPLPCCLVPKDDGFEVTTGWKWPSWGGRPPFIKEWHSWKKLQTEGEI